VSRSLPTIALPKLPALPRLPGGGRPLAPAASGRLDPAKGTDEFGLGIWAVGLPRASRRYIAVTYEHFGLDKSKQPTAVFAATSGTVPESVTMGWLLTNHYGYKHGGPRGFDFQGQVLGGRAIQGGGAVVDFIVYRDHLKIGLRVESVYHSAFDPFGRGGVKSRIDFEQGIRLQSRGAVDLLMSDNLAVWGFPLESGPDDLVELDLSRIERIQLGGADER
jgi:hypothetical protein